VAKRLVKYKEMVTRCGFVQSIWRTFLLLFQHIRSKTRAARGIFRSKNCAIIRAAGKIRVVGGR